MGLGLFQFALLSVIQLEQCAFVGKEQNIQIVLWLRRAAFSSSKNNFCMFECAPKFKLIISLNIWHNVWSSILLCIRANAEIGNPQMG